MSSSWQIGGRLALGALLAFMLAFLLQMPPISLRGTLIGNRIYTAPELGAMEFGVGLIASIVILAICLLTIRRPPLWLIVIAVIVQLVWNEFARGFSVDAHGLAELVIRYAQQVGVVVGGVVVFMGIKILSRRKDS